MIRLHNIISIIYRFIIKYLALFILVAVLLMGLISITYITETEVALFLSNNISTFIGLIITVASIIFISNTSLSSKISAFLENDQKWNTTKNAIYFILLALGVTWVLITQFIPEADQMVIQNVVCQLHEHNYESLIPGGYLDCCTNQIGLTIICYILSYIFGQRNYLLFQLVNAFGVVIIHQSLVDIMQYFGCKRITQLLYLCCGIVFFPIIVYTSLVYGTILGLMFSVVAFKLEIKFFSTYKKKYILGSSLSIAVATVIKSNSLVLLIAVLVYAIIQCDKNKYTQHVIYILCVIACVFLLNTTASLLLTSISGYELNQGYSPLSYIAMGLSESWHGPGWFSSLLGRLYSEAELQSGKQSILALAEIQDRINTFISDRTYTFRFFTRKIASQWNEPTFQSLSWFQNADSNIIRPPFIMNLFTRKSEDFVSHFLNIFQSIIYLGSILWLILCKKEEFNKHSIFILSFIGGFVFHLFWEAKSQYTIVYFSILIPCALMGYEQLILFIKSKKYRLKETVPPFFVVLMLVVLFSSLYLYEKTDCLRTDDEYYYNSYLPGFDD